MWSRNGNNFSRYEKSDELEKLPPGVYTLKYGQFGSMYLHHEKDKFEFGYKLYGSNGGFPERVMKTYRSGSANMGVMLYGLKGTGKTVEGRNPR